MSCGAVLPRIPEGLTLPQQKRGHLATLEAACLDLKEAIISPDEFLQVLSGIGNKVEASLVTLREMERTPFSDPELEALIDEEYGSALRGAEMMLEALAEMVRYIENTEEGSTLCLDEGLQLASQATDILNHSIDVGQEVNRVLGMRGSHHTESFA
ncbi:MAG: hypothetical protein RDV48_14045 [Candidatus Eremiobacteraeota bacterium]|nr:hypothetical protein [Candidatus Eremiobacteraeota bacterium]